MQAKFGTIFRAGTIISLRPNGGRIIPIWPTLIGKTLGNINCGGTRLGVRWAGWVAGSSWDSPAYYDYGEGIYYEDEQVYVNGRQTASAEEYYQQASDLAKSAPPAQESETEWLPLGVFAVSREKATDSNAVLQLAVEKNGVIAGTYYNTTTDIARPVRGMVDKKTQRAAWTFSDGKNTDIIMETGLFNLTQDQTEALVHFGKEKTQQWLMVRLDQPKDNETAKEGTK